MLFMYRLPFQVNRYAMPKCHWFVDKTRLHFDNETVQTKILYWTSKDLNQLGIFIHVLFLQLFCLEDKSN